ncbi:MAG: cation:proton antiporter [Actinobacteria bacterium]|nr:cation:proton antiporter [Actinomycetota bacterium]
METEVEFGQLLGVMAVAVSVPLLLGLVPRLPIPASVVEIVAGIVIGPAVLGWVEPDQVIVVLAKLGVGVLLFLAGIELDFRLLRGRPLKLGIAAFALSLGIGLACTMPLGVADVIIDPLFVTVVLSATALGIVMPVLKDTGQVSTKFGTIVIATCTVAEFGSIVALSMLFSGSGSSHPAQTMAKLAVLALAVLVIAVVAARATDHPRFNTVLRRLENTSSQIRVRIAVLILIGLLVLAADLKLDAILGAFLAGALLAALGEKGPANDDIGHFRHKVEGIGFGFFVPVFFVSTGLGFPLDELFSDSSALLRIPLFLVLLLAARGLPALLLRRDLAPTQLLPAALLQATSLSFIVVATEIGVSTGELRPINAASLLAAGMCSVLVFPASAVALLRRKPAEVPTPDS